MHSTNYSNTLICPAEDCQHVARVPEKAGSVAAQQYEFFAGKPYQFTSDEVLSAVAAMRKGVGTKELDRFRGDYFSKGQPCFRASPLTKTYGWAVHSDENGRVALFDPDGDEFAKLREDGNVKRVNAMRNKRA